MKKLKPEDRKKIEKSLAVRVAPPTDKQLKRQQLQDLKQSLELAQRVQAIKLEMRSLEVRNKIEHLQANCRQRGTAMFFRGAWQ